MCDKVKETRKFLEVLNEIPTQKVFLFSGVFLIGSAFIQYNSGLVFSNDFSCERLSVGMGFVFLSIILLIFSGFEQVKRQKITTKGKIYRYNDTVIVLQIGNIEDRCLYSEKSVVVLPANTAFNDDCITDKNSALGAFFSTHYLAQLEEAKTTIISTASRECKRFAENENEYALGSTILLPVPFNSLTAVAISAVTTRQSCIGISADLCSIVLTIKKIFEITADKKIDTIVMPAIGSGHGGVSLDFSINTILLNIKYNLQHYHHIKNIKIVIHSNKQRNMKLKLVNWRFL